MPPPRVPGIWAAKAKPAKPARLGGLGHRGKGGARLGGQHVSGPGNLPHALAHQYGYAGNTAVEHQQVAAVAHHEAFHALPLAGGAGVRDLFLSLGNEHKIRRAAHPKGGTAAHRLIPQPLSPGHGGNKCVVEALAIHDMLLPGSLISVALSRGHEQAGEPKTLLLPLLGKRLPPAMPLEGIGHNHPRLHGLAQGLQQILRLFQARERRHNPQVSNAGLHGLG